MANVWDYVSAGVDLLGAFQAIKEQNAMKFSMMFTAALSDGGRLAGVKELTPEVVAEFSPEIEAIFAKITAHVNAPAVAIPHG